MADTKRALIISFGERYLLILLKLMSFVVLARLLTPEDIGIFSVAAALIGLAHVLRDFGVGSYLIQETELTDVRIRTAFTLTLCVAISLFLGVYFLTPVIASFYEDDRLQDVLFLLAFNFLIIPFNSTTLAVLRRNMEFGVLFWINLCSAFTGAVSAIVLAMNGFSYMSLAWSSIAATATICLGGLIYRRNEFWLRPTFSEWRRVASFGAKASFANVVTAIAMDINDLVIGKVMGFSSVAIISRAKGTMNIFHQDVMGAIRNVAYPTFAKANREKLDLEEIHTRAVTAITAIAWPFYGFLAIFPLEIIRVLFGNQWDAAVPLVPFFCLAGAIAATWNLVLPLLMAMGEVDTVVKAELTIQIFRIIALVTCVVIFQTEQSYAIMFMLVYALSFPVFYFFKQKKLSTDWRHRVEGGLENLKLTCVALLLPIVIKVLLIENILQVNEYVVVGIASICVAIGWWFGLVMLNHPVLADPLFPQKIKRLLFFYKRTKEC